MPHPGPAASGHSSAPCHGILHFLLGTIPQTPQAWRKKNFPLPVTPEVWWFFLFRFVFFRGCVFVLCLFACVCCHFGSLLSFGVLVGLVLLLFLGGGG